MSASWTANFERVRSPRNLFTILYYDRSSSDLMLILIAYSINKGYRITIAMIRLYSKRRRVDLWWKVRAQACAAGCLLVENNWVCEIWTIINSFRALLLTSLKKISNIERTTSGVNFGTSNSQGGGTFPLGPTTIGPLLHGLTLFFSLCLSYRPTSSARYCRFGSCGVPSQTILLPCKNNLKT